MSRGSGGFGLRPRLIGSPLSVVFGGFGFFGFGAAVEVVGATTGGSTTFFSSLLSSSELFSLSVLLSSRKLVDVELDAAMSSLSLAAFASSFDFGFFIIVVVVIIVSLFSLKDTSGLDLTKPLVLPFPSSLSILFLLALAASGLVLLGRVSSGDTGDTFFLLLLLLLSLVLALVDLGLVLEVLLLALLLLDLLLVVLLVALRDDDDDLVASLLDELVNFEFVNDDNWPPVE